MEIHEDDEGNNPLGTPYNSQLVFLILGQVERRSMMMKRFDLGGSLNSMYITLTIMDI